MTWYFYCPNCGHEQDGIADRDIPQESKLNLRGGYGTPIYHWKCPCCNNLDAGAMFLLGYDEYWKRYCQTTIGYYQGARGFAKAEGQTDYAAGGERLRSGTAQAQSADDGA